jgi:hypothetical protein
MKKTTGIFLILLLFTIPATAQRNADIGIYGGSSFYLGDLNPTVPFKDNSYSFGGIYRYNINKRYAIRGNLYYANIKGSDFNNKYPQFQQKSFSTNLLDAAVQFEFNYLPYLPTKNKYDFSTYLSAGLGYSSIMGSNVNANSHPTIPFGIGFKINITNRLSAGSEWTFRKTFNDNVDGLSSVTDPLQSSTIHNNDWYSFFGLFITYKFFKFAENCPVYLNN